MMDFNTAAIGNSQSIAYEWTIEALSLTFARMHRIL